MTTVGVCLDSERHEPRIDALRFPSYNYHYPHFKKKQVCDCVQSIFAKEPPIFRRTPAEFKVRQCDCAMFENSAPPGAVRRDQRAMEWLCLHGMRGDPPSVLPPVAVPAPPKPDLMVGAKLNPKERARWAHDTTPVVTTKARSHWNDFLLRCPERFDIKLPLEEPAFGNKPYYDGGYGLRFLRPDMTRGLGLEPVSGQLLEAWPTPSDDSPYRSIRSTTWLLGQ